jgi:hypothetical protein
MNHGSYLPASWCTLYELTKLSNDVFETGASTILGAA